MKTKFNQSKLKLAIVSAIMACSAGLSASSYAATTTATMTVTSSVLTACTMTTGDLTFGAYDPSTQANVDGTATITSTCTSGGGVTITLGQGTNADTGSSDAVPLRQMADGTNRLKYHLYGDSDRPRYLEIPQVQDKMSLEVAALKRLQSMVGSLARKTRELLQELTPTAS